MTKAQALTLKNTRPKVWPRVVIMAVMLCACTSIDGSDSSFSTTADSGSRPTNPTSTTAFEHGDTVPGGGTVVTRFEETAACDSSADDADLQVVQAFVTAYNEGNEETLASLVGPDPVNDGPFSIYDAAGLPYLGSALWEEGIHEWAAAGWAAEDNLQLTLLVRWGASTGSTFELIRANGTLKANGIEAIRHSGKAHSVGCTITHIVLYLPSREPPTPSECRFFEVFERTLREGLEGGFHPPASC